MTSSLLSNLLFMAARKWSARARLSLAFAGLAVFATACPPEPGGNGERIPFEPPAVARTCVRDGSPLAPSFHYARATVTGLPLAARSAEQVGVIRALDLADPLGPGGKLRLSASNPIEGTQPVSTPVNYVSSSAPRVTWRQSGFGTPTFTSPPAGNGDVADLGVYPAPGLGDQPVVWQGFPGTPVDRQTILTVETDTCRVYEQRGLGLTGWDPAAGQLAPAASGALDGAKWSGDFTPHSTATAGGSVPVGLGGAKVAWSPHVLRWDELQVAMPSGATVGHVLGWVGPVGLCAGATYRWPARASGCSGAAIVDHPPLGSWFRLRASYPETGLTSQALVVVRTLKTHGAVLIDSGSQGLLAEPSTCSTYVDVATKCWLNTTLSQLKIISISDLQVVDASSIPAVPGLWADPGAFIDAPEYFIKN